MVSVKVGSLRIVTNSLRYNTVTQSPSRGFYPHRLGGFYWLDNFFSLNSSFSTFFAYFPSFLKKNQEIKHKFLLTQQPIIDNPAVNVTKITLTFLRSNQ